MRLGAIVLLACCALTRPALAQIPATDSLLLEHRFDADSETLRVSLQKGVTYRIRFDRTDAYPRFRIIKRGENDPVIVPITRSGERYVEVYPSYSGDYDLSVEPTPVSLQLFGDLNAAEKRRRSEQLMSPRFGVEAMIVSLGGYRIGTPPEEGNTGTSLEGCIALQVGAFGTCLGVYRDYRSGADKNITWFFAELRGRLLKRRLGRGDVNFGLSFRLGQGNLDRKVLNPTMYSPGVWLAYHVGSRTTARGVWIRTAVSYGIIDNTLLNSSERSLRLGAGVAVFP